MRRTRLIWQLFPTYLLITILSIVAVSWFIISEIRINFLKSTTDDLVSRAILIEDDIQKEMLNPSGSDVDSICKNLGRKSSTRITVLLPDGTVLGDSESSPTLMDNHKDRPEIASALSGEVGQVVRYSDTIKQRMMYIAIPINVNERVIGAVRVAVPLDIINSTYNKILMQVVSVGIVILFLSALIGYLVSKRISQPLEELRAGAERFSHGEFDRKLPVSSSMEITSLAETLNSMADQLDERIRTIVRERNENQAVLASMVEGVMAIDSDEKIIQMNKAAGKILEIEPALAMGRFLHEVVRNPDLQKFFQDTATSSKSLEREIAFRGGNELYLQAHGTHIYDAEKNQIGILIVLNDMTRLRKLETVRRDFVANVSHELKTPITSIKGFIETLREGAIDNKDEAKRFLEIVADQADRLNAIIEDLLSLSKIETESESREISFETYSLKNVLEMAIQSCAIEASGKAINLELECDENLKAEMNPQLIEQAVINLISNAIKYSNEKEMVRIGAVKNDSNIEIFVIDHGIGIAKEHLPRLFERFYRVDKSRSRNLGGTGLGLAIVKHIAQAHNGDVSVKSTVGEGSDFRMILPSS